MAIRCYKDSFVWECYSLHAEPCVSVCQACRYRQILQTHSCSDVPQRSKSVCEPRLSSLSCSNHIHEPQHPASSMGMHVPPLWRAYW